MGARIALLSDASQLTPLLPFVQAYGADVDLLNDNAAQFYSALPTILEQYDIIVADLTGADSTGRKLYDQEILALDDYVAGGGKLVLTGPNILGSPENPGLALLVGSMAGGLQSMVENTATAVPAMGQHTFFDGPYVPIATGSMMNVAGQVYDNAVADPFAGAVGVLAVDGGHKVIHRLYLAGEVVYWSGNLNAGEWTSRGVLQDLFRNILFGMLAVDVAWLDFDSPLPLNLPAGAGDDGLSVIVDATGVEVEPVTNKAAVLLRGNLPGMPDRVIVVSLRSQRPGITVESSTGVVRWDGEPLQGDGSANSSIFQVLYAGLNGVPDDAQGDGSASGDDELLLTVADSEPFSRIGYGYEFQPGFGKFEDRFQHTLPPGALVFVRAWDAPSFDTAVAYGDSELYAIQWLPDEVHDFGTWTVGTVPGYPGTPLEDLEDKDEDSIPDGWAVLYGLDPRDWIGPLAQEWTQEGFIGGLHWPGRVVMWSNMVFVADTENDRVVVLDSKLTTFLATFGSSGTDTDEFTNPHGIAVDPARSRVVVADTWNSRLTVLTVNPTTGALALDFIIGGPGTGNGQFNRPYAVDISPSGRMVVADTLNGRIQVLNVDGSWNNTFGASGGGDGYFNQPRGLTVDRTTGRIYVADTGNSRVQCFSGGGVYLWKTGTSGSADGEFLEPQDVHLSVIARTGATDRRMYVADRSNHRVQIFDAGHGSGTNRLHLGTFGGFGVNAGELRWPEGVFPAPDDNIAYVADTWNDRVQRMRMILDADQDGMDDVWESLNNLDPTDPDDWDDDNDGDGVINIGEYRLRTNPWLADTDGDGLSDGEELAAGYHPGETYDLIMIRAVVDGGVGFEVQWLGKAGGEYRLEYRDSLLTGTWQDGGTIIAPANGMLSWPGTTVTQGDTLYYRVIWLNP